MDLETCEVEVQSPAETSSGPAKSRQTKKALLKYGPLGLASSLILTLFIVVFSRTSLPESSKKEIQSRLMSLKDDMGTYLMDPNSPDNIGGLSFIPESSKKEIQSRLMSLKDDMDTYLMNQNPPDKIKGLLDTYLMNQNPPDKIKGVLSNVTEILMPTTSSAADIHKKKMRSKTHLRKPVSTCDNEWKLFHRSCYYFTPSKSTWQAARELCKEKGGDLAIIESEQEQIFLVSNIDSQFHWIGLTDIKKEGKWLWVDGTALDTSVTFWNDGEPNNHDLDEHCALLFYHGKWNDLSCTNPTIYAICEKTLK